MVQRGGTRRGQMGVMGCREEGQDGDGGMRCAGMQNEEISKETVREWGDYLPHTWS